MVLVEQTILEQGINRRTMDSIHAYEEGLNQEWKIFRLEGDHL